MYNICLKNKTKYHYNLITKLFMCNNIIKNKLTEQ